MKILFEKKSNKSRPISFVADDHKVDRDPYAGYFMLQPEKAAKLMVDEWWMLVIKTKLSIIVPPDKYGQPHRHAPTVSAIIDEIRQLRLARRNGETLVGCSIAIGLEGQLAFYTSDNIGYVALIETAIRETYFLYNNNVNGKYGLLGEQHLSSGVLEFYAKAEPLDTPEINVLTMNGVKIPV